jgi:AbrB family looped-hinge helix DNA binding protein
LKNIFTKIDKQGKLTIPPELRNEMGLEPGSRVKLSISSDHIILHRPVSKIARLYIEPTTRCNLRCKTCMRNVWDEPIGDMDGETFKCILQSLQAMPDLPVVFFGGFGEPFVHPEIIDMIKSVKRLGAPVEIITNGILVNEKCSEELIDIGLDMLWVSIDGASPECYGELRPQGSLADVIENLKTLKKIKLNRGSRIPRIGISFVVTKRNVKEFPDVIKLGYQIGVQKYLVTNVYPHTPELLDEILYMRSIGEPLESQARVILPRIDLKDETSSILEASIRGYYGAQLEGLELLFPSETCPFIAKGSIAVRWDGMVSPCLPLLHTHVSYLGERLRVNNAYSVGSILENPLHEIWSKEEYSQLRMRLEEFDFSPCATCNSCEMASSNEQDCFGNIIPACGGCLWAQGFIQCP